MILDKLFVPPRGASSDGRRRATPRAGAFDWMPSKDRADRGLASQAIGRLVRELLEEARRAPGGGPRGTAMLFAVDEGDGPSCFSFRLGGQTICGRYEDCDGVVWRMEMSWNGRLLAKWSDPSRKPAPHATRARGEFIPSGRPHASAHAAPAARATRPEDAIRRAA